MIYSDGYIEKIVLLARLGSMFVILGLEAIVTTVLDSLDQDSICIYMSLDCFIKIIKENGI